MSGRRAQSLPPHMLNEKPVRGRCITAICISWKVITCIVSHVTLVLLVVSYCVGGAYLFQHLEKPHELEVKKGIQKLRENLTDKIWIFSDNASYLSETNWIANVTKDLAGFEQQILTAMKQDGWDGTEDTSKSQWTFAGSLFYSIIVITTIGYGHISPHTDWGKVTTIFYAIVGIPLMLLCLSNIGDVMATSFRFLYWRVCCYVCTRTSKRPRNRSRQRSTRTPRYVSRSQSHPFKRSIKLQKRSAGDSGLGHSIGMQYAYSDPELRTVGQSDHDQDYSYTRGASRITNGNGKRFQNNSKAPRGAKFDDIKFHNADVASYSQTLNKGTRFSSRQRNRDLMRERHTIEREHHFSRSKPQSDSMGELNRLSSPAKRSLSVRSVRSPNLRRSQIARESQSTSHDHVPNTVKGRAKSVDPRSSAAQYEDIDEEIVRKTPIISNRYAIDELDHRHRRAKNTIRSQSMPRSAHHKHINCNQFDGISAKNNINHRHILHNPRRSSLSRQYSAQISQFGNHLELPELMNHRMERIKSERTPRYDNYDFDEYNIDEQAIDDIYEDQSINQSRYRDIKPRRQRSERLPPSPRIMSPMGFAVKRQVRRRPSYDYEDDSTYDDDWSDYGEISPKDRPVPIWLCVFLVVSYILGGAALFAYWEQWSFLDSAYFCFITLTTIGFGDFVPAKGVKDENEQSIAYCALYLLFGIALLAMSFNLVQEEFIANVKEVARRLGILKDDECDD